jgi:hypothetical protein
MADIPETEKMTGIKYNPMTTKPIININGPSMEVPPGALQLNTQLPQNGPFPLSYFGGEAPVDNKLMSFLKNNNNI